VNVASAAAVVIHSRFYTLVAVPPLFHHSNAFPHLPCNSFRYLFDFRRINIYFLFCRTNSVRDLIFV
jgi:hypothetical protein